MTRYPRLLSIVDLIVVLWATAGAFIVRFGLTNDANTEPISTYAAFTVLLAGAWWLMLGAWETRSATVLGSGAEEYKRVFTASLWLFGLIAILSYAFRYDTPRGYVGLALPAGLIGLLIARWMVRQILRSERSHGRSSSRVLVIGGMWAVDHLVSALRKAPLAGYRPVGAHFTNNSNGLTLTRNSDVVVTDSGTTTESILQSIDAVGADSVAISAGSNLHPHTLRQLGWELAARDIRLILAPALTDIAGPRIHTQPVAGLPLVHVSTPKLTGVSRLLKRVFDIVGSASLIVLLSPVLLVIAVLVKVTSTGSIFYSQERIGVGGATFKMLKFRSMIANADAQLNALLAEQGREAQPLFKVEDDPRITKVGKFLRKYSLDELPQLFNVLLGSMSMVGPRPQRASEVALYDDAAHRRLYVSPGMSGLWQVSGRSNLSWEESIQLDLYYVENWSLTQDLLILFKTFRAVVAGDGAV
ncbi:sugar transferase [uncultured Arthrobacter sp.]|uniref:sugar transferase n=1 Tax=uncultured Arthrobacter sp. TaxID=114050 RepID=UPI0026208401|nr:sugar transferase [uncultured Arthrobacter sp.]